MGKETKCFYLEKTDETVRHETKDENGKVIGWGDEPLYRRTDTGEKMLLRNAPAGAIYFADWYGDCIRHQLEFPIIVVLPDGTRHMPDRRASNCTLPEDNEHFCWVIHGEPPMLTIDKAGRTCRAGAGSLVGHRGWHGFLENGILREC